MRFPVLILSFCLSSVVLLAQEQDSFEGRIEYAVNSGGMEMTYTVWMKGSLWRSELRSGKQLYEQRLGDIELGTAYLVNDGGKSYRALGRGPGGPPLGGRGPEKKQEPNLGKLVSLKERSQMILDFTAQLEELRGPGKKLSFWWSDEFSPMPGQALPRLKAFEDREQLLAVYFRKRGVGFPLAIENAVSSGKGAFSMRAIRIDSQELDIDFMSLPDGYKMEAGGRPGTSGKRGPGGGGRGPGGGGRPPR